MTTLALYDIETNGLLEAKEEKGHITPPMDKVWCNCIRIKEWETGKTLRNISAADQPGFTKGMRHYYLSGETIPTELHPYETPPEGAVVWERMSVAESIEVLMECDIRVAHNGQDFDERALLRVFPWFKPKKGSILRDTLLMSRVIYPDIYKNGPNGHKLFPFEKMSHGVEAWGKRLGRFKGDYSAECKKAGLDPWVCWRPSMQWYCDEDVEVLDKIFTWLWAQQPDPKCIALEHDFAAIIRRQETRGWAFDMPKAEALLCELQDRATVLEAELIEAFGTWYTPQRRSGSGTGDSLKAWRDDAEDEDAEDEEVQESRYQAFLKDQSKAYMVVATKARNIKLVGFPDVTERRFSPKTGKELKPYVGPPRCEVALGAAYTPLKLVEFNPSSRTHIWQRLMFKYGWKPFKFTPGGKTAPQPIVDEDVLRSLPYPEADKLAEYFLLMKRIGQLATGNKSWIKFAKETEHPNGTKTWRIHGRINTCGAATGRCTHSNPNVGQVPKNSAGHREYPDKSYMHGDRCRELFITSPGMVLAGFDGAALELRMLAHYISPWDGGEYAHIVHEGRKEDGTDPHSWLRDLIGIDLVGPADIGRDRAKTIMYATLYGAGNLKVGSIVDGKAPERERIQLGREILAKMESRFTAKAELSKAIVSAVMDKKYLVGLDGRKLPIRKPHAALNTLLQSAGAVTMKKALVVLDRDLQALGLTPGREYEFVGNIHDEAQAEILPAILDTYREAATDCIPKAGRLLKLRCPLAGEPSFGHSWKDTH